MNLNTWQYKLYKMKQIEKGLFKNKQNICEMRDKLK